MPQDCGWRLVCAETRWDGGPGSGWGGESRFLGEEGVRGGMGLFRDWQGGVFDRWVFARGCQGSVALLEAHLLVEAPPTFQRVLLVSMSIIRVRVDCAGCVTAHLAGARPGLQGCVGCQR